MSFDKTVLTQKILCTVVSFILCICLFALAMALALGIASSGAYLQKSVSKSSYAELSFTSLLTELSDLTIPSGLPIDFFDDKLDKSLYSERVYDTFKANMTKSELSYTKEDVTEEFFAWSMEYARAHSDSISSESEEALRQFSSECATRYMRYSNPSSVKYVTSYLTNMPRPLRITVIVSLVIGILCSALLIVLNKNRGFVKYFCFSLTGAALLSGIIPLLLLITKEVRKISLSSPALYSLTVTYIEGILWICVIFSVILLVVTATTLAVSAMLFKRKHKEKT